ncbi:MAG TPA: DUF4397 domain-containing protein [Gemmatimonadales bacterium]|nr:DUF4397 domain-containing protein [Gemmatimonadales bacterium]
MNLKMLSLLVAVGAMVTACGDDDDNGTGPETSARVRIVHLSPDAPEVDVLVDDVAVATDVPYRSFSDYLEVEAGSRNVQIRLSQDGSVVLEDDVVVADGEDYTLLVGNVAADLTLDDLTDDNSPPAAGTARVRLIHGAPSAGDVDIYVTAPGDDLSLATPALTGVAYGDVSSYLDVPAGSYQVRITPTGTRTVVIDTGTLTLASGQVRTGIAVDAEGGGAPYAALLLDDLN